MYVVYLILSMSYKAFYAALARHNLRYSPSLYALFKDIGLVRLNFSISQGHWRSTLYNAAPLQGGAPGVELFAVFDSTVRVRYDALASLVQTHLKICSVDSRWTRLVKQLNGLFCASFAIVGEDLNAPITLSRSLYSTSGEHIRYGAFTGDNICTENAESFRKLLPCQRVRVCSYLHVILCTLLL